MLISEFASKLLLSPSLEDKLYFPKCITDDPSIKKNIIPDVPAREEKLSLSRKGEGIKFAEFKQLKNDEQRGHCLHFFANHELQAIELMALALLKFPEMPSSLKRQLVSTIQDEQKHTRLYLNRMKSCNLQLGDDHLNRFFWDSLSQVSTIDSFLAGMSLTLEQANLDFAYDFIQRFHRVGDIETSKVLEIVLKDEIKHVRLGLEFFKKKYSEDIGVWDAYCKTVEPPLFPSRAKAEPFQKEIRQQIGFHEKDIEALMNYQRSKGRPPTVYFYNAFPHDFSGVKHPSQLTETLNHDFQLMPLWLSKENDIVVTQDSPDQAWMAHLRQAGVKLPEFIVCRSRESFTLKELGHQHLTAIYPWVLHQGLHAQIKVWNQHLKSLMEIPPVDYDKNQSDSKFFAHQILEEFFEKNDDHRFGDPKHSCGIWIDDEQQLIQAIDEVKSWGYPELMLKSNYGCAGQSIKKIITTETEDKLPLKWVRRIFSQKIKILVQPCFKIVAEFSLTGQISNGELLFNQVNHLLSSFSGRYCGHLLNASWNYHSEELRRFMLGGPNHLLGLWKKNCQNILAQNKHFFYKNQNLGLDSYVYRDLEGELKFMPISEINSRTTFGHLAASITPLIGSGKVGYFWLCPILKDIQRLLDRSNNPLLVSQQTWLEGIFCLSDPSQAQSILPLCVVAENLESCLELIDSRLFNRDEKQMITLTPLLNLLKMDSHRTI
jgi:uncharacterized ferritin-like protein (DUF455 family)